MELFISGIGMISAQPSLENNWQSKLHEFYEGDVLPEPVYEDFLDARQLRRMSRILKAGTVAALTSLKEAKIVMPDFIITGTGLGCMEDTGIFLENMIDRDESALNPTPFIQSTHNTIGSCIALALKCHGYNQTYVHSYISFEQALQDAMMLMNEQPQINFGLVGAVDERTELSSALIHLLKSNEQARCILPISEGMVYFALSRKKANNSIAGIVDVTVLFECDKAVLKKEMNRIGEYDFLVDKQPDLILLASDDSTTLSYELAHTLFSESSLGSFKRFSGDHYSASGFAVGLAARILRLGVIPEGVCFSIQRKPVKNILILNQTGTSYYSLILLKAC